MSKLSRGDKRYATSKIRRWTEKTVGLDADQTEAAIKATIKMLNIVEDYIETVKTNK